MKYILALSFLIAGCASYEITQSGRSIRTEDQYFSIVDKNTDRTTKYSGLYNLLEMQAVMMNSELMDAQVDQLTRFYLWEDAKIQEEKGKREARLNKETEFFLSFYTPNSKNDDLQKDTTLWKTFLDVDGRRYQGKVTKIKSPLAELVSLYPTHNRFFTPYSLTFPVAMKSIEGKEMTLTVTGPVGSGTLHYNKK